MDEMINIVRSEFLNWAGKDGEATFFSPGRVNLIGEHTDYNGGHVFPCAISLGTYARAGRRSDRKVRLYSMNFAERGTIEFDLDDIAYDAEKQWANYPMGVVGELLSRGFAVDSGLDILYFGNLPNGAGLSSSASIEVLTAVVFNSMFSLGIGMIDLVKLCQEAENRFVGVNCGIMDQFSVGMGKENCAILLDCNNLSYRYSKIELKGCKIVIANTNKKRALGDSKYNERRRECEEALKDINRVESVAALGELTGEAFERVKSAIQNPALRRRARHAVLENERTLLAVDALENNDLARFGELMNQSHVSLRDDYEATGTELDTLAELAWRQDGVVGSRMTGAGFGGCTVSIVKNDCLAAFQENVARGYREKIGYAPSFYAADIGGGARKLEDGGV